MTDEVREEKEFSGALVTVLKNLDDFVKTIHQQNLNLIFKPNFRLQ